MSEPTPVDALPDYRFWCEEKTRNADTDKQGHVNNAVIATFFESGRIEVLSDPAIAEFRKTSNIVVVRMLINIGRELFFPGKVRIGTRVSRVGRTSLDFASALFAENGAVATSEVTCVLVDKATRKPTPIPEGMRVYLTGS